VATGRVSYEYPVGEVDCTFGLAAEACTSVSRRSRAGDGVPEACGRAIIAGPS